MTHEIIKEIEKKQLKKQVPSFGVGDTIVVHKEIIEGKKKRIQKFQGIVTKKQNARSRENFTVRKVVDGVGVEKTFLLHSPLVVRIDSLKKGIVKRAKLFYLRKLLGSKASRVKTAD